MKDPDVQSVLTKFRDRLLKWYKEKTADDTDEATISGQSRLRGVGQDGDADENWWASGRWSRCRKSPATSRPKAHVKCRLTISQIKAAFMQSQNMSQMNAGQVAQGETVNNMTSEMAVLDFNEFIECIARVACFKFGNIKAMSKPDKISYFIRNLLNELSTEDALKESTYIRATRFEVDKNAKPLPGQSETDHRKWLAAWGGMELNGIVGFPRGRGTYSSCCRPPSSS